MTVTVYTANFGRYDQPRPFVEQTVPTRWLYISEPDASDPGPHRLWIVADPVCPESPMLSAKYWKMHPPVVDDVSIWIDANMSVTSPDFVKEAVAALDGRPFAVWKHPRRDDYMDEAVAAISTERQGDKYDDEALRQQAITYESEGLPRHAGLYACGTIVWTPDAWPLGRMWWQECERWTPQDQVSLPYVCWRLGVEPAVFPYPQLPTPFNRRRRCFQNRWLRIYAHGA